MAANRRRSTRKPAVNDADSPVPAKKLKTESQSEDTEAAAEEDNAQCPACQDEATPADAAEVYEESWIRCDGCQKWHHWRCVKDGMPPEVDDPAVLNKWFCKPCLAEDPKRSITVRPPARKSARQKKAQEEYVSLHGGTDPGTAGRWVALMRNKPITQDSFKRMKGSDVSLEWIDSDPDALKEPIVIETPDGLGMKMPGSDFTVQDVAETIGEDHPVEVIDVATQSNSPGWTVGKWAEYFNTPASERDKIRNVISLEISATTLADQILPPRLVRDLDWVEKYWPSAKKGRGHQYPKVQLYCLMGVADAWTDWHVDFAGSSVYYHIVKGAKTFYFIRPSAVNLAAYERWSSSDMQTSVWLGDMVDEVIKVELTTGNTMIIPTGWIHAVATPQDTLVFGGNFLHSYNIGTQLKICGIENRTNVPKKFRFPYFTKLCWFVAEKLVRDLKAKEEFSQRVMDNLEALTTYLMGEVHSMERGSEQAKKVAKEHVPGDRIKDAPALARELRWRLRLAAGVSSDDEGHGRRKTKASAHPRPESASSPLVNGHGTKRKRESENHQDESAVHPFRNFRPKPWTISHEISTPEVTLDKAAPRPLTGQDEILEQHWGEWKDEWEGDGLEGADVRRQQHTLVRVRRTEDGLERQRIERTVEKWTWRDRKDVEMNGDSTGEASATVIADGASPAADQSTSGDESAINVDS